MQEVISTCTGQGKSKATTLPWPSSTQAIGKQSTNAVNKHFIESVLTPTRESSVGSDTGFVHAPIQASFQFKDISVAEVRKALKDLPQAVTIGFDKI